MLKKLGPYLFVSLLLCLLQVTQTHYNKRSNISRDIASDCTELISQLIKMNNPVTNTVRPITVKQLWTLRDKIWNKLLDPHEFHQFDNIKYQVAINKYMNANAQLVNPVTIEEKLAFIEVLSRKLVTNNYGSITNLSKEIEALSTARLKKMQTLLQKLDLSSKLSTYNLEIFTREFMMILKGPPKKVEDYLSKSPMKMHFRLNRMVQEDVLRMGLEEMVKRIPEKTSYTKVENLKHMINKLFQYKIVQLYFLPYYLPKITPPKIPDELLKKILLEGLDKHELELKAVFKKQNRIDNYENFKRLYTPIAYTIGIYYYYHVATQKILPWINEKIDTAKVKKEINNIFVPMNEIYN